MRPNPLTLTLTLALALALTLYLYLTLTLTLTLTLSLLTTSPPWHATMAAIWHSRPHFRTSPLPTGRSSPQ